MKRILYITSYASPYRVEYFDALGEVTELTVLFTQRKGAQKHRDAAWFHSSRGTFRGVELQKRLCRIKNRPLYLDVISWLKKPYDHIVVHGYGTPTNLLAIAYLRLHKIPFEMEVDGGLIRPDSPSRKKMKAFLLRGAQRYWSSGKTATGYLAFYGVPREKIVEYPFSSLHPRDISAAPAAPFEKAALREKLSMPEERIILSVGQFIPRKGYDLLFQALSKTAGTIGVYIVGGEPTETYLQLQKDLGLSNVHFVGFRKKEALMEYYRAADAFVLPTREDIWGLVVNEAMAAGLPVISTNRCGAAMDLVETGVNGVIVPVGDTAALALAMERTLSGDLEAQGRAAISKIQNYTTEQMVRCHLAQWEGEGTQ